MSILDLPSARVMLPSELPFTFCAAGVGHDEASTPAARRSAFRVKSLLPAALLPFCAGVPAIGVGHCAACAGRGVPPAPNAWFGPPFSASDARGVPHIARANSSAFRLKSLLPAALFPFCAGVPAIGVGHFASTIVARLSDCAAVLCPAPCA
jgi:hypothetical protein